MIVLTDVTWLYHQQPMRFTLSVQKGERIAILGPSGAGKSTLLNLIAGFLTPAEGHICLAGEDHTLTPPSVRPVSMLFQENNLFSHLTIRQNIALGMHPGMRLDSRQQTRLLAMAEKMGLKPLLDRLPAQLSGGQRQRAALARCLVRRRPVLLLDEPFSALDPALRQEMLSLLDSLCREEQLTLLMVSHSIDDAARIAPRSLVIAGGKIFWDGQTDTLLQGETAAASLLGIEKSPCRS